MQLAHFALQFPGPLAFTGSRGGSTGRRRRIVVIGNLLAFPSPLSLLSCALGLLTLPSFRFGSFMNGAFPSCEPFFSFTKPLFPSTFLGECLLLFSLFTGFLLAHPFHPLFHFSLGLLLLLLFLSL